MKTKMKKIMMIMIISNRTKEEVVIMKCGIELIKKKQPVKSNLSKGNRINKDRDKTNSSRDIIRGNKTTMMMMSTMTMSNITMMTMDTKINITSKRITVVGIHILNKGIKHSTSKRKRKRKKVLMDCLMIWDLIKNKQLRAFQEQYSRIRDQ